MASRRELPDGLRAPARVLAERLRVIEEELADLAYEQLRDAASGGERAPEAEAAERVIQSARRAVAKAAAVLDPPTAND